MVGDCWDQVEPSHVQVCEVPESPTVKTTIRLIAGS